MTNQPTNPEPDWPAMTNPQEQRVGELIEEMRRKGWTFGLRCHAYQACPMKIHFTDPKGHPHGVLDEDALQRYFGRQGGMAANGTDRGGEVMAEKWTKRLLDDSRTERIGPIVALKLPLAGAWGEWWETILPEPIAARILADHAENANLRSLERELRAALTVAEGKAVLADELALRLRAMRDTGAGLGVADVLSRYDNLVAGEIHESRS